MQLKTVKTATLFADKNFNSRKVYKGHDDLRESIKRDGLINPILVSAQVIPAGDAKGRHLVLAGYRRFAALIDLGWDEIPVQLVDVAPYSREAFAFNIRENIEREDLSTFELAKALSGFKSANKLTDKEVSDSFIGARQVGSKQVNNLVTAIDKLHPDILTAWEKRHPICRTDFLFHLKGMPQDNQIREFQEACGKQELALDGEEANKQLAEKGKKRLSRKVGGEAGDETTGKTAKRDRPDVATLERVAMLVGETEVKGITPAMAAKGALVWAAGMVGDDFCLNGTLIYSAEAEKAEKKAEKEGSKVAKALEAALAKVKELEARIAKK